MSGIVGILNLDGAPVDRTLLQRMTDFMKFRGPDEQRIWVDGNVGFGHTLLRTTFESEHEHQPFTLDGKVWIVADARVDAQDELIAKLNAQGEHVRRGVTDVELLLRAYRTWGEDCVDRLLGDFAFAVWDDRQQRLFCARDHLGVKPFFYADLGATVIFSNTLDCIRQHPAISNKLNDLAIADFLLFDVNQDPATTSFADIQRIPPAHVATWSVGQTRRRRYWTLPAEEPLYFKRATDYTDHFTELLDAAVDDRLRTNKLGIFMSGGVDSPTLAATACKILRQVSSDYSVHAFTTVVDGLDGNERYYAGLVSEHLGIPIHVRDLSTTLIHPGWDQAKIHTPEAVNPLNLVSERDDFLCASKYARVWFHGEGPDDALKYEWRWYLGYLAKGRRVGRLIGDVCRHMWQHRRVPLISSVPRILKEWQRRDWWYQHFPEWVEPGLVSRLQLQDRWKAFEQSSTGLHHMRPTAHASLNSIGWESHFRSFDAQSTSVPIEVRHPFVDLRLLRYMLAVPVIPWCRAKLLIRRAMRDHLPAPVLRRPKSPLRCDPVWEGVRRSGLTPLNPTPALGDYVNLGHVPKNAAQDMIAFRTNVRPWVLNYWLRNMHQSVAPILSKEEIADDFVTEQFA
jgi:asparagine synthase (glutamine-hydrolysing)